MYEKDNCCEMILGNSVDIEIKKHDCEIRADVVVEKSQPSVRLWGQIKDCDGRPMANTLIKLVKVCYEYGKLSYEGIAHTVSDCQGFYQFDLCSCDSNAKYKLLVGRAAKGSERTVESEGNCDVCNQTCGPCDDLYPCDSCPDSCSCDPCDPCNSVYSNCKSKKKHLY